MTQKLPVVLKFSDRNMSRHLQGTIGEHVQVIKKHGYCWWAWWQSKAPADQSSYHIPAFRSLTASGPAKIGLFSSSLQRAYIATVAEVYTAEGHQVLSPTPSHTPEYYRDQPWPVWLKITEIVRIDSQPIGKNEGRPLSHNRQIDKLREYFRDFPRDLTVSWRTHPLGEGALQNPITTDRKMVLHLSDLHFGAQHRWHTDSQPTLSKITLLKALEGALHDHSISPQDIGPIVVSGDLIDKGPTAANSFDEAENFLTELFQLTGNSSEMLVVTPGNHDIVRYLADDDKELPTFEDVELNERQKESERPYREFLSRVFGYDPGISLVRTFQLPENRLNFLQADSTALREQKVAEFGWFGHEPLDPLMRLWRTKRDSKEANSATFLVFHHHLISSVDIDHISGLDTENPGAAVAISTMVDQSRIIDLCSRWEVRGVLCGHQHAHSHRMIFSRSGAKDPEKPYFTEIFSAGSAGCKWKPDDVDLSFNLFAFNGDTFNLKTISLSTGSKANRILYDVTMPVDGFKGWGMK